MNHTDETIRCRPSQLVNLRYLPGVLLTAALLFLPKDLLSEILPVGFLPEKIAWHILRVPWYLMAWALFVLGYHILKVWCIRYEITTGELKHSHGILSRRYEFIELYRIKDFQVNRPLIYRLFGLGDLMVYTSDKTSPIFWLRAIQSPGSIYAILRDRVERNRREKHVFEVD
jgi:uncharacterized membrane protein YdbT with pleckstrin-like domain